MYIFGMMMIFNIFIKSSWKLILNIVNFAVSVQRWLYLHNLELCYTSFLSIYLSIYISSNVSANQSVYILHFYMSSYLIYLVYISTQQSTHLLFIINLPPFLLIYQSIYQSENWLVSCGISCRIRLAAAAAAAAVVEAAAAVEGSPPAGSFPDKKLSLLLDNLWML